MTVIAKLGLWTKIRTKQWLVLGRLFNVYVQVFCAPNATILFVYIPPKIKMSFIWKDAKIGIFCKSITGSVSPYSFGRRIKLIICQIKHELSITIHEISTSWKENVWWRIQYVNVCAKRSNEIIWKKHKYKSTSHFVVNNQNLNVENRVWNVWVIQKFVGKEKKIQF